MRREREEELCYAGTLPFASQKVEPLFWRPGRELHPRIKVLQTLALLLGYQAILPCNSSMKCGEGELWGGRAWGLIPWTPYFRSKGSQENLVGGNGVEPFTPYLSDKCSTAELTAQIFFSVSALPGSHLDSRPFGTH